MDGADIDAVRKTFDALIREERERAAQGVCEDITWHNTRHFPGPAVLEGLDEILAFWRGLLESFQEGENQIVGAAERKGRIVLDLRSVSRGRASGAPLDVRWAAVCALRDGRIARVDVYGDYSRALEAAEGR